MAIITIGDPFEYKWYQIQYSYPRSTTTELDLLEIIPETKYHHTTFQIASADLTLDFNLKIYMKYAGTYYEKHTYGTFDSYDGQITISPASSQSAIFTLNDVSSLPIKITGQSTGLGEPAECLVYINYCIGR